MIWLTPYLRQPRLSSAPTRGCGFLGGSNKLAIGKIAKKAAEELGCEQSSLRDFLQTQELVRLTSLEDLTVRLIDLHDIHPLIAVKQAAERLLLN